MEKKENNYAFIDGNNLYRGVNNSGSFKRTNAPIIYLNNVKNKISLNNKEKAPIKDKP